MSRRIKPGDTNATSAKRMPDTVNSGGRSDSRHTDSRVGMGGALRLESETTIRSVGVEGRSCSNALGAA